MTTAQVARCHNRPSAAAHTTTQASNAGHHHHLPPTSRAETEREERARCPCSRSPLTFQPSFLSWVTIRACAPELWCTQAKQNPRNTRPQGASVPPRPLGSSHPSHSQPVGARARAVPTSPTARAAEEDHRFSPCSVRTRAGRASHWRGGQRHGGCCCCGVRRDKIAGRDKGETGGEGRR